MADITKTKLASVNLDAGVALTFTAADTTDQTAVFKRGDVLIAWNAGLSTRTVTVYSAPERTSRRVDDITAESIGAGAIRAYYIDRLDGWKQSTGKLKFKASHADVKFAVLTGLK